jgi:hypothetical protein
MDIKNSYNKKKFQILELENATKVEIAGIFEVPQSS